MSKIALRILFIVKCPKQLDYARIYVVYFIDKRETMTNSIPTTTLENPTTTLTEKEGVILDQLSAGDHRAMDYMFDTYYNMLCNKALGYVKDTDKAEDVVQDVMLNIWKKRATIKIDSTLKGYLLRSVVNRSFNVIRAQKNHTVEFEDNIIDASGDIEEKIYYSETEQIVMNHVNKLSPRCRQIFIMNRLDQMKYREIAAELEISTKTVEHHIAKALHILRDSLSGLRMVSAC